MRELRDYRSEFPILEHTTYLVSHSLGPMPRRAAERFAEYARMWEERGIRAWAEGWWASAWTVGDQIGRIVGAPPGSTVMHQNVTIAEAVALSCFRPVDPARNRVVYERGNFPSVRYLYQAQPELEVVVCEDEGEIVERIDERTLLVPISHVLYKAGEIQDVEPIVRRAHEVARTWSSTATSRPGSSRSTSPRSASSFAVGGSVKWLCGGPGTAGSTFVPTSRRRSSRASPAGRRTRARSRSRRRWSTRPRAARFLTGTPNPAAHFGATAGYDLVEEIGVARIREARSGTRKLLIELADAAGFEVVSPREQARRGGSVVLGVPEFAAVHAELEARGILCDFRPDAGIRLGPHFFTSDGRAPFRLGRSPRSSRRARTSAISASPRCTRRDPRAAETSRDCKCRNSKAPIRRQRALQGLTL